MTDIEFEAGVGLAIESFRSSSARAESAWEGLRFNLERDPDVGVAIPGTELLCTASRPFLDLPLVRCWFTYDPANDRVRIVDFRVLADD